MGKTNILFWMMSGLLLYNTHVSLAQEVRFSQYQAAPLLLNPASPGTATDPTLAINYRLQRFGVLSYRTGYFSAMLPLYQGDTTYGHLPIGGLGLGVMSDLAGEQNELRTIQLDFSGAYNLRLNVAQTHYLTFGLQLSYLQTSVDYGELNWPSQITYRGFDGPAPVTDLYEDQIGLLRINTGFIWTYDPMRPTSVKIAHYRLQAGLSVANLNQPAYSFINDPNRKLPQVYRIHGGADFRVNPRLTFSPNFFAIAQGSRTQVTGGSMVSLHLVPDALYNADDDIRLSAGVWYRHQDAFVFVLGGHSPKVDAALSFDTNASSERAGIGSQNSIELSLAYRFHRFQTPQARSNPLF